MGLGLIESLLAWEALDSRGTPTVACAVRLEGGEEGEAIVPSGASTGSHEAHERRDGGERYGGRGVLGAVAALRDEIAPALAGRDVSDQEGIDDALRALDGTPDLRRLGANAVLAASVACAVAAAAHRGLPLWQSVAAFDAPLLPLPMVNVISGGAHAGRVLDVQDFLVVPVGASSFSQAIEWCSRARAATALELARLANETQRIDYEQARLELEKANNSLTDLLGPVDENDIQVAEANVTSALGAYSSAANSVSDADIEQAQLRYEQAQHMQQELEHQRQVSGGMQTDQYTL